MQMLIYYSLKHLIFPSDGTGIPGVLLVSSEMLQCGALNKLSGGEYFLKSIITGFKH